MFLAGLACMLAFAADDKAEGERWWAHVSYLAGDDLQGRDTGSPGYEKGAQYVEDHFRQVGLKPAGNKGYRQNVKFNVVRIVEKESSVSIVPSAVPSGARNGKPEPLTLGEDAAIGLSANLATDVDAPAVFIGYGLRIPEAKHDDLTGSDLTGKIVVILSGAPKKIPGPLAAHSQSAEERWKALKAAGVIGIVTIPNPKSSDIPWARAALARFQPSLSLADTPDSGLKFSMRMNAKHADKLFKGTGHTISEILGKADKDEELPHFPLPLRIRAHVTVTRAVVESPNLVGVWPGSDPKLKNEYVVLSAHLDHVGVGEPIHGDPIYNGAMDNASGVAAILDVARLVKEQNLRPKRSLVFLAVCGEEKGLLGSKYFATHPTVGGSKSIVADVNLDMFLPLFPLHSLEVMGLDESTLGDDIRAAASESGVSVFADRQPQRNRFIRSDQYSFIRRGIPSLSMKFGYEPGSAEAKKMDEWVHERYHAPSDDLNQPVDKEGAAKFEGVLLKLVQRIANNATAPQWKPDSFFRRFAAQ
jgi:Zn-dependent M28 family amino/carboxypeptidase